MEDNIDAALVCENWLREHTWTINGKFLEVNMFLMEDNIDAALVCENWLREHTWTINGKFQEVDAALSFWIWNLKGTREPSTGGQSWCDPGLERGA